MNELDFLNCKNFIMVKEINEISVLGVPLKGNEVIELKISSKYSEELRMLLEKEEVLFLPFNNDTKEIIEI